MDISELKVELEKLHPASFGWALNCCGHNWAEAEEVLQTVYLKILQGKATYRGECKLQTWLFAVIRKTAITEHRKQLVRALKSITGTHSGSSGASHVSAGHDHGSHACPRSHRRTEGIYAW